MEGLQSKHRKEQRDLQARITQKKKSATKKTRKGVNEECNNLEEELRKRQATELAALDDHKSVDMTHAEDADDEAADVESRLKIDEGADRPEVVAKEAMRSTVNGGQDNIQDEGFTRKPNRQKARLARRAAEQEAIATQAAEEAAQMPDERERERQQMLEQFKQRGLREHVIRADGHCLYSAIADQMGQLGLTPSLEAHADGSGAEEKLPAYLQVRHAAAKYITTHSDDFVPFLEEPLDEYVHKVRNTGEWGGQLELNALANTYGINIKVLQGDGRTEDVTPREKNDNKTVWLAYYRHGFGLGEHYNSLRKAP
ncbi:MAG: hypothetical protein M1820_010246 [Bogoriella megaspora]|nr:MAG: hypothetical protein M1820_010246 [Bogoriella megaspora]